MDFERMSFRTPNYSDAIMDSLLKLQQGGVFCDAVLKGKDVEAKVHKVILMATDCEFFKEQMTKSDMGNTTENPCIVEIDTESQVDLDCLVKELYTGCLELTTSNVRNMFKIYETLKMNDQLKFCHQFENFLLRPPDPNKSSEFTGLDMLDESKVSAIVCEGSDIVQVIKEEVADDTDIRDILESSLKQTEILQGADIEMSDNENKTLKSEELKGEELSSGVQQWEVAQIAISEKGEGEQIASGGDGGSTEESQSEIENVDESTVKSENGDVEEDDMEGFEVVDEYIEDEQEENKEKINEAPPAKKLKRVEECEMMVVVEVSSDSGDEQKSANYSQQQAWRNAAQHVADLIKSGRKLTKREKNAEKLKYFREQMAKLKGNSALDNSQSKKNGMKGRASENNSGKAETQLKLDDKKQDKTKDTDPKTMVLSNADVSKERLESKGPDTKKVEHKEEKSPKAKPQDSKETTGNDQDKGKKRKRKGTDGYFCNHCKFRTSKESIWNNHCNMVCPLIRCEHCPASFVHRDRYRSHMDRFHPKSLLNDQPKRLERLKFALSEMKRSKDHVCSYCGENFILRELYEYHLIEHKRKETEQKQQSFQQGQVALQQTVSFQQQTTQLSNFGNKVQFERSLQTMNQRESNFGPNSATSFHNQSRFSTMDNVNRQAQFRQSQRPLPSQITTGQQPPFNIPSLLPPEKPMFPVSSLTSKSPVSYNYQSPQQPQISKPSYMNRGNVGIQSEQNRPSLSGQPGFLQSNQNRNGSTQPSLWGQGTAMHRMESRENFVGSGMDTTRVSSTSQQRYPPNSNVQRPPSLLDDADRFMLPRFGGSTRPSQQASLTPRSAFDSDYHYDSFYQNPDDGKNPTQATEMSEQKKTRSSRKRSGRKRRQTELGLYVTAQPLQCPSCDYETKEIVEYNRHQRVNCKNPVMCKHCHVYFSNSNLLTSHQESVHLIRCNYCKASFYDQVHMDHHLIRSHSSPKASGPKLNKLKQYPM